MFRPDAIVAEVVRVLALPYVDGGTGVAFSVARAPSVNLPYGVVHVISSPSPVGDLVNPHTSMFLTVQVDAVGARWDQTLMLLSRIRQTMVGRDDDGHYVTQMAAPAGHVIADRLLAGPAGALLDTDGTPPNVIYSTSETYDLLITPA